MSNKIQVAVLSESCVQGGKICNACREDGSPNGDAVIYEGTVEELQELAHEMKGGNRFRAKVAESLLRACEQPEFYTVYESEKKSWTKVWTVTDEWLQVAQQNHGIITAMADDWPDCVTAESEQPLVVTDSDHKDILVGDVFVTDEDGDYDVWRKE